MKYPLILLALFLSCESEVEVSQFNENRNSEEEVIVTPTSPLLLSASKSQLIGIESANLNVSGGTPNYIYSASIGSGITFSGNTLNYDGSFIGEATITVTDQNLTTESITLSLMGTPEVWINAGDLIGTLNSNDPVSSWPDRSNQNSGSTYDFQATGVGEEPIFINDGSGPNGEAFVRFDGTKCMLTQDPFPATNEFEIFIVYQDDGAAQSWEKMFGYRHSNGFAISRVGNTGGQIMMAINAVIDGPGQGNLSSLSLSDGDLLLLHGRRETDNTRWIDINGMSLVANTVQDTNPTSNISIGVGCNSSAAERFGGDIMEVITYRSQLTPAARQFISDYLTDKYGI